ncbi:hypothetical protein V5799_030816 [Amblyomma americanum]|uniref:Uncharacterized protein n=1 Tax=Amblyomma americanum TaxID=6943 RepID=A0AAQ4EM40_AMBAM
MKVLAIGPGFRNKTQKERPNRFVVEMCMVTSKEYSSQFNSTEELIQYIALMLNAAALSFIDLKDPKIRFQLNQVFTNLSEEIINTTEAQPDITATLDNMKNLSHQGTFNRCDIAFFISRSVTAVIRDAKSSAAGKTNGMTLILNIKDAGYATWRKDYHVSLERHADVVFAPNMTGTQQHGG